MELIIIVILVFVEKKDKGGFLGFRKEIFVLLLEKQGIKRYLLNFEVFYLQKQTDLFDMEIILGIALLYTTG